MANSISFTPLATTGTPSPSPVTFTPTTGGDFEAHASVFKRRLDTVTIDRTDVSYVRNRGLGPKQVMVKGLDTFNARATAETQLAKIQGMEGASCTIVSDKFGTVTNAICMDVGQPEIRANLSPGWHIHYELRFEVQST